MKQRVMLVFLALIGASGARGCAQEKMPVWTWLHRKCFSPEEQEMHSQLKEICFSKVDLPSFSQLMFSWNAVRPKKGHFTFFVQVRSSKTKQWGKWHRMMEWGNGIQASYKSMDHHSQYHHVRLEMTHLAPADGFSIKIVARAGASLALVHAFAVTVSDFTLFSSEAHPSKELGKLTSVLVKGAPTISQFELEHERNNGLCSPTSCTMLTRYVTGDHINAIEFAENSFDSGLDKYGSWPFNMAHAYERAVGKAYFYVTRCNAFKNLHAHLKCGIPVVVSVRGMLRGAPREYTNGHLLMVVGYDAERKQVLCHDPAASCKEEVKKRYDLYSFLQAWERSHRLTYLAEKICEEKECL